MTNQPVSEEELKAWDAMHAKAGLGTLIYVDGALFGFDGAADVHDCYGHGVCSMARTGRHHEAAQLFADVVNAYPRLAAAIRTLREERRDAIAMARMECERFDLTNDWPDTLHMADVIEKRICNMLWDSVQKSDALTARLAASEAETARMREAVDTYNAAEAKRVSLIYSHDRYAYLVADLAANGARERLLAAALSPAV